MPTGLIFRRLYRQTAEIKLTTKLAIHLVWAKFEDTLCYTKTIDPLTV